MAVQFILGRAGTGKTRLCLEAAAEALRRREPQSLILLVPEQATYQMEQAVLSLSGIEGYHRLRILSFQRLGYWLSPAGGRWELSRVGRQMIVQRLVHDCRQRLELLGSEDVLSGSAAQLADVLAQLYRAQMTPDRLEKTARLLEEKDASSRTPAKLKDLAVLLGAYQDFLDTHQDFYDAEHLFCRAAQRIAQADFLQGARLWVDGFSGFTAREEALLLELLKVCSMSQITLCLDASVLTGPIPEPFHIFGPTERTYQRLCEQIRQAGLDLLEPIVLEEPRRWSQAPALEFLERHFAEEWPPTRPSSEGAVVLAALPDIRGECLWTARQIRRLVRQEQLRYRQIAVVVPEMASYQHLLVWAFERLEIPYFLDQPRPLRTHPVAELLDSALQAVCFGFRLPDMTAYLKTGLTGLTEEEADWLDNYCRACGIEGQDWFAQQPWSFADTQDDFSEQKQKEIDRLRRRIAEPLGRLSDRLGIPLGREVKPEEFVGALWEFLETLQVRQMLELWAREDPSDQQAGHRQMWEKMVQIFDELCLVFRDRQHPPKTYLRLLQAALSTLTVKLIPPTLDQVLIGQIERSRHPDVEVVFLLGATQKQFPAPLESEGFFSRDDRALLEPVEPDLAETLQRQLLRRRYLAYIALTRPRRRLILTRPLADENGSPLQPWSGLETLRQMFADLTTLKPAAEPQDPQEIQTESEWALYLCQTLGRDSLAEASIRQTAAALLQAGDCPAVSCVRRALEYRNHAELEPDIISRIYTRPLKTSVSRLESFAACPYQHFASYVLHLKKRRRLRLEPLDLGSFYHTVLDQLFRIVRRRQLDWSEWADDQIEQTVGDVARSVIEQSEFLQSFQRHSAHQSFLLQIAVRQLVQLAKGLKKMITAGRFLPWATEVRFGDDGALPPLTVSTEAGDAVCLKGFIDRLDCLKLSDGAAAVIFDYKTGQHTFRWAEWFYGLDLQMPVYLLAVDGRTVDGVHIAQTTGAFYIPIQRSMERADLSEMEKTAEFSVKAKGFLDGRFAEQLDAYARQWSPYYNFAFTKEREPYSSFSISGALHPHEYARLLAATKQKIGVLAQQMLEGQIAAAPYQMNRRSPCSGCEYKPVCKFDWEINSYRFLSSMSKEDVLSALEEAADE
jgi:ATP-dependent helicase/nuclease subunit B